MPDSILDGLTDAQREAVAHRDGPLLVVAGAGTGKTRVVTRRIAHLVAGGVPAGSILACTFTNKAAGEMRERVANLVGADSVLVSTFHSLGARLLRRDAERLGYRRDFTILDTSDQLAAIRECLSDLELDARDHPPAELLGRIEEAKREGLDPQAVAEAAAGPNEAIFARVYGKYEGLLRANQAMDFSDLLLNLVRLFRRHDDVLARTRRTFRYVLVDEYQDTNRLQYDLARLLADEHRNLCVTGDPDQSIYAWRGADIRNILDFQEDFPEARVVKLERNYRSTKRILAAASGLIARNRNRIERGLFTEGAEGAPLRVWGLCDDRAEADAVAEVVADSIRSGTPASSIAVFYRTNALSRSIEQAFARREIPYTIVGNVEFFHRKEVRDLLAYLTLLVNPSADLAFRRIVNTPPRGVGKGGIEKIKACAAEWGVPLAAAVRRWKEIPGLQTRTREGLRRFAALLDTVPAPEGRPVADVLRQLLVESRIESYLTGIGTAQELDRLENLRELVNVAAEYDREAESPSAAAFLERTALISETDRWNDTDERVSLMTLHSAKGLEFPEVYIVGLEDGLLPHSLSQDEDSFEEERRLLYVGITRAQERLTLTWAAERLHHGRVQRSLPSPFLEELPEEAVETEDRTGLEGMAAGFGGSAPAWSAPRPPASTELVYEWDGDVAPEDQDLSRGDRVRHTAFGVGVVAAVDGSGANRKATIDFQRAGRKRLLVAYAGLRPA